MPFSHVYLSLPRWALLAILMLTISACGGGGGGGGSSAAPQEPAPTSSEVNSNAIKGPLENTEITLTDAGGAVIDTFTGSGASFVIDLPASTNFPVTVTSSGGVDSILGNDVSEQSIVLKSVIFSADQTVVNLNPFTTLLVDTALAKGGLTEANLDASVSALGAYSFGLPEDFNPVTSAMTDANTPGLLMSFEAMFEVFRRVSRQTGKTPNEVIASIAADLSDDIIDGAGSDGIDSVSTALFNTNTADVLLESLSGTLTLDAGGANEKQLAASDLNAATGLITGNVASLERAGLEATERTKSQAVAALNVALRSADAADKDALGKAVNFIQTFDTQNPPTEEETALVRTAAKTSLSNLATKNADPEAASSSNQNASQVFSNPDNNLPLAVDDLIEVVVGSGASIVNPLANDTGLGDTPITLTILSTGAGGSVTLNTDNTFTFTPDAGFFGGVEVAYDLTDADGETTSAVATLYVDDLPVVQNFDIETAVGANANINVIAVTSGTGNAPVTFSVTSAPSNGSLSGSGGVFVYTPNAGFAGSDSASITVEDADGDTAVSQITIYVDDQPVAVNDSLSTPIGTPISASPLDNDSGLGNEPITVTLGSVSSGGSATLNGGNIDFQPNAGFGGSVTVNYTVTDADGDSDTAVVTFLVDDIPVANSDSSQTTVGIPVTIAVLANDSGLGNAPVSISVSDPPNGSATVSGANVVYTPGGGFTGDDSFTYTVTDADGDQANALVNVFVDALPVAVNDVVDTQRDAAILVAVLSNDNLGNTPTALQITTNPTNGTVVISGNNIQYTPAAGFGGLDTFGYQIIDVDGDQSTATVSVNVDDFPVLVDQNLQTPLNTALAINLLDGAVGLADTPIVLAVTVMPANGVLVVTGTTASYTPNAGFAATDTFQYTATDNNGDVDTATISVLANDTPAAGDDLGLETPVGVALNNINVLANDIQLGNIPITVTVNGTSLVGGTTVVNGDNTINFTPTAGFGGQGSFVYTVQDNDGESATASVQVFVEDIPAASTDSVNTPVNTPVNIDVLANDTGKLNTPLTVTISTAATAGTAAVQGDNTVTYTPNPTTVNTDNFNYTVSDSDGDMSIAAVAVFMDDTPVAVDDTTGGLTTEVATLLNIAVVANDTGAGNTPLTFSTTPSANAVVNPNGDDTLNYTPNAGFAGNDSFTYSFTDSDGDNSGVATVNVFVNDTPVAVVDSAGTPIDTPVVIDVLANDTGKLNGITALTVTSAPTGGTVDTINVGAGTLRYVPNITGLSNNDAFDYQITDTDGQTSTATVNVGVGFAASGDLLSVVENTDDATEILGTAERSLDVLSNDALGPPPDATITAIDTTGTAGLVAFTATGITYTPPVGAAPGADSFTYTITSASLAQNSTATVTVNLVSVCTQSSVRCVGSAEEYDTAAAAPNVETAFQSAIDDAAAGDTILVRGGTYNHIEGAAGQDLVFMYFKETTKGTSGNPITIRPFKGETAIISGYGFPDCSAPNVIYTERDAIDFDGDGNTTEPNFDVNDERGNATFVSTDGSQALVPLNIIKVAPGHTAGGDVGKLYRYRGAAATINLGTEDYTKFISSPAPNTGPWEIVNFTHPDWGKCFTSLVAGAGGVLDGVGEISMEPTTGDEILLDLEGDYIVVRDFVFENSTRNAIRITGNHNTVENVLTQHSFKSNITINSLNVTTVAPFGNIIGNTLKNVESAYARHEVGINITPSSDNPRLIENTTIIDSYSHHSGYQPDGRQVPGVSGDNANPGIGGGNADGMGAGKVCHDFPFRYAAQTGQPEPPNLCPGTIFKGNVSFHNADDGIDNSTGGISSTGVTTALVDNIAFNAGPEGNKAFKFFSALRGGADFRGNIGVGVSSFCLELQWEGDPGFVVHNGAFYCLANGWDLRVREMATVDGLKFKNNNSWNNAGGTDGRMFSLNSFAMGGTSPDKDILATNNFMEDDFTISGGTKIYPNSDKQLGSTFSTSDVFAGSFTNTLMLGRNLDAVYTTVDTVDPPAGSSITQKIDHYRQQFHAAFKPKDATSPLVDAGDFIAGIHCPLADDNGQDPTDDTCRHWMGAAPDIGPYEFGLPLKLATPP